MKLTKPQQRVFDEMTRDGVFRCVSNYAPAKKLIDLGLAVGCSGSFGSFWIMPVEPKEAEK